MRLPVKKSHLIWPARIILAAALVLITYHFLSNSNSQNPPSQQHQQIQTQIDRLQELDKQLIVTKAAFMATIKTEEVKPGDRLSVAHLTNLLDGSITKGELTKINGWQTNINIQIKNPQLKQSLKNSQIRFSRLLPDSRQQLAASLTMVDYDRQLSATEKNFLSYDPAQDLGSASPAEDPSPFNDKLSAAIEGLTKARNKLSDTQNQPGLDKDELVAQLDNAITDTKTLLSQLQAPNFRQLQSDYQANLATYQNKSLQILASYWQSQNQQRQSLINSLENLSSQAEEYRLLLTHVNNNLR
jgi:hypothetical protein